MIITKDELDLIQTMAKIDDRWRQFLPEWGIFSEKLGKITIGISKKTGLPVTIDPGTSFRILIAGQSETGKSFVANRIVNEFISWGGHVVILDIRGEYRKCFLANREHAQYLMPGEVPKGMPESAQFIPEFCRKDMSPGEIEREKKRATFFSLAPFQIPKHTFRRLLGLRDTDPGFFLLESALSQLGKKYSVNDLKSKIDELPTKEDQKFYELTKKVLVNKITVLEQRKVLANRTDRKNFFNFKKVFTKYNCIFNFMYAEDDQLLSTYIAVVVSNLYKLAKRRQIRKPFLLVVDEADLFLNRRSWDESKKELLNMIKLARMYRISTVFISQTPALLPDLISSQSNYLLIGCIKDYEDAAWICKSRGFDPRYFKNHFINQDFQKREFAFIDDRFKKRIQHVYVKSCLSKHEQPLKR